MPRSVAAVVSDRAGQENVCQARTELEGRNKNCFQTHAGMIAVCHCFIAPASGTQCPPMLCLAEELRRRQPMSDMPAPDIPPLPPTDNPASEPAADIPPLDPVDLPESDAPKGEPPTIPTD